MIWRSDFLVQKGYGIQQEFPKNNLMKKLLTYKVDYQYSPKQTDTAHWLQWMWKGMELFRIVLLESLAKITGLIILC